MPRLFFVHLLPHWTNPTVENGRELTVIHQLGERLDASHREKY
jgi:hypothetical protein